MPRAPRGGVARGVPPGSGGWYPPSDRPDCPRPDSRSPCIEHTPGRRLNGSPLAKARPTHCATTLRKSTLRVFARLISPKRASAIRYSARRKYFGFSDRERLVPPLPPSRKVGVGKLSEHRDRCRA
jgi:hypothetical protein